MLEISDRDEERFRISTFKTWVMLIARLCGFPLVDFFFKILNRSHAIGVENIPRTGGVMLASNHVSGVDTMLIPTYCLKRFSPLPFMSPGKEQLFRIPIIGTIISLWGSFPVKRGARDITSMKRIMYYLKRYMVMIFPEGTRTKTGELGQGKSAVGWIVYNARPVVIPTLVINTDKFFWPKRPRPWFRVPYVVVFGEPLNLDKYYSLLECDRHTSQKIADEIMGALAALKEKHKDLYIGRFILPNGGYKPEITE